ncbi:hypothetical protein H8959_009201 [Pygathrix nigripes]
MSSNAKRQGVRDLGVPSQTIDLQREPVPVARDTSRAKRARKTGTEYTLRAYKAQETAQLALKFSSNVARILFSTAAFSSPCLSQESRSPRKEGALRSLPDAQDSWPLRACGSLGEKNPGVTLRLGPRTLVGGSNSSLPEEAPQCNELLLGLSLPGMGVGGDRLRVF